MLNSERIFMEVDMYFFEYLQYEIWGLVDRHPLSYALFPQYDWILPAGFDAIPHDL